MKITNDRWEDWIECPACLGNNCWAVATTRLPPPLEPSRTGSSIRVAVRCESFHRFELVLTNHKGILYVWAENCRDVNPQGGGSCPIW